MRKLTTADEIWPASVVTKSDIDEALNYATISIPWTFDRMRYGPRAQNAVNNRLIHIMMGVLNQSILERELTSRGLSCSKDWTKYRESDIFDFKINNKIFDVKTTVLYSKYNDEVGREPFSPKLFVQQKDYCGSKWRQFFPLMVTLSQLSIKKQKDAYIFGIAETEEDIRKTNPILDDKGFWCAVPFGKAHSFFHSPSAIVAREEAGNGFKIVVTWNRAQARINGSRRVINLTLFGEWDGETCTEELSITEGKKAVSKNLFSSLSCLKFDHPALLNDNDDISVSVDNKFKNDVPKPSNPLINLNDSDFDWKLGSGSFVNLLVPDNYKVYWIGFIPFNEFASKFADYPSYFIPKGDNMDENQAGRVNERMKKSLLAMDKRRKKAIDAGIKIPWPAFEPLIDGANINAGFLLVAQRFGRAIGAACYYYPPYAMPEGAIYVLPKDLYEMAELKNLLAN
jgi:hypothetical protein